MARYTKESLEKVVAESRNFTEVLKAFDLRAAGGNHKMLRLYVDKWDISTDHFETKGERILRAKPMEAISLEKVLIENSSYSRGALKARLLRTGALKEECALCGQGPEWQGRRMSLILDHINGIYNDNRIENLQIVCPNCNATLDTHCGKNQKKKNTVHEEVVTDKESGKLKKIRIHKLVGSKPIKITDPNWRTAPKPKRRKAERPPYEQLLEEIDAMGYCAVGRKYGVSDNAVRKWVKTYKSLNNQ